MNKSGITLLELLLSGAAMIGVTLLGSMGLQSLLRLEKNLSDRTAMGTDLVGVTRYVARVGKVAQLCRKKVVGGNDTLECTVDFTRPATGVLTWVRFLAVGGNFEMQEDVNNDGEFTETSTRTTHPGVAQFSVCDDDDMDIVAHGVCRVKPDNISTFHTRWLLGSKAGRFFRYSIKSNLTSGTANVASVQLVFQGSFYRRNPTPFTSPLVVYQW